MSLLTQPLFVFTIICISICRTQKLVVVVVDGFGGSMFHRFSHLPGLRTFEEEGTWSHVVPVFPTLPLPNRHSLMTGLQPRRHGIMGEYMYNHRNGEKFANFSQKSDFDQGTWWTIDPIYVTAAWTKATAAAFFFPECKVPWIPCPSQCVPPRDDGKSFADEEIAKEIVQATKTHDLVMVYHPNVYHELSNMNPAKANTKNTVEIDRLQQSLERLTSEARERLDLNVIVVSPHGMTHVPAENVRSLEDYISMELINTTVNSGAIKQIQAHNGKTHQIFNQLRNHTPIPNVNVYYTQNRIGNMPKWYLYRKSSTVADLLLVAEPGYAIVTGKSSLRYPQKEYVSSGMSGYNNHFPDMRGLFLAYGPLFKRGYHKGGIHLTDIYHLMCRLLRFHCNNTPKRLLRIDDVLSSDARVAMRAGASHFHTIHVFIPILLLLLNMFERCRCL